MSSAWAWPLWRRLGSSRRRAGRESVGCVGWGVGLWAPWISVPGAKPTSAPPGRRQDRRGGGGRGGAGCSWSSQATQCSPSSKSSFFQMGTGLLQKVHGLVAGPGRPPCGGGDATAMTRLISPMSTAPMRWAMATSFDAELRADPPADLLHLPEGHRFVGLVLQADDPYGPRRTAWWCPGKVTTAPLVSLRTRGGDLFGVQGVSGNLDHASASAHGGYQGPPRPRPTERRLRRRTRRSRRPRSPRREGPALGTAF